MLQFSHLRGPQWDLGESSVSQVLLHGFYLFFYLLGFYFLSNKQTNKQMKTGGISNAWVTIEWKLLCLSCDAKACKHYTFVFKIIAA